jgi:nitroreductase
MDTLKAIQTRRSVRKYTEQPVTDEQLREILKAAMSAPSAGNEQAWQFLVIRERESLRKIAETLQYGKMTANAQLAVIICGDLKKEVHKGYWVQDCSAAAQNFLLAAHELGLGAVWLGVHPVQDRVDHIRKLFALPEHVIPLGIFPIGYPNHALSVVDRYNEAAVHYERW